ncbi:hypothetical protein KBD49_02695 [Myxococcota bacterium]|nr:hypothetical protein [Myxococcota bacterium]
MRRERIAGVLVTMALWGCGGGNGGTGDPGAPADPGGIDVGIRDVPVADPGEGNRDATDSWQADPAPIDPGTPDLGPMDPGAMDPGTADPGAIDTAGTDPGVLDPGTADPGPQGPPGHTEDNGGAMHLPGKEDPLRNCTACHGSDLAGGTGPSCYDCHDNADHTRSRGGTMHRSGSSGTCTTCHGPNNTGGLGPACSRCH